MRFSTTAAVALIAALSASAAPAKRQDATPSIPSEGTIWFQRSDEVAALSEPDATGAFLARNGLVYQYSSAPDDEKEQATTTAGLLQPEAYTIEPVYAATMDDMIVRISYAGKTCRKRAGVYLDCTGLDLTQPEFFLRAMYRSEQSKWELLGGYQSFSTLETQNANVFQLSADPRHIAGWTAWLEEIKA